jgi:hypothetical protein
MRGSFIALVSISRLSISRFDLSVNGIDANGDVLEKCCSGSLTNGFNSRDSAHNATLGLQIIAQDKS